MKYEINESIQTDPFSAAAALYWYCERNFWNNDDPLFKLQDSLNYRPGIYEDGPDTDAGIKYYELLDSGVIDPGDMLSAIDTACMVMS